MSRAHNLETLSAALKRISQKYPQMKASPKFDSFYTWCFQYVGNSSLHSSLNHSAHLEKDMQKALDGETAAHVLRTIIPNEPHVESFCKFIQVVWIPRFMHSYVYIYTHARGGRFVD